MYHYIILKTKFADWHWWGTYLVPGVLVSGFQGHIIPLPTTPFFLDTLFTMYLVLYLNWLSTKFCLEMIWKHFIWFLQVKASLFAAGCFSELSDDFACTVLEMLVNMLTVSETSPAVRLAGARVLAKIGCSYSVTNRAYQVLVLFCFCFSFKYTWKSLTKKENYTHGNLHKRIDLVSVWDAMLLFFYFILFFSFATKEPGNAKRPFWGLSQVTYDMIILHAMGWYFGFWQIYI